MAAQANRPVGAVDDAGREKISFTGGGPWGGP